MQSFKAQVEEMKRATQLALAALSGNIPEQLAEASCALVQTLEQIRKLGTPDPSQFQTPEEKEQFKSNLNEIKELTRLCLAMAEQEKQKISSTLALAQDTRRFLNASQSTMGPSASQFDREG